MYNILKDISWAWKYAQFVKKKAKKNKDEEETGSSILRFGSQGEKCWSEVIVMIFIFVVLVCL